MAIKYDGCGNYAHSDVYYIARPNGNHSIDYIAIKDAKPFKNKYGLDLFVVTADIKGTDDNRLISSAGSVTDGMTGMKLCMKPDFEACVVKYGIDKINKIISDFIEKHGWSPRYSRHDEKMSELFPVNNEPEAPKPVLLTPLFIDGNFNRSGKRVRMLFYKTVSSINATYDLYISASKIVDNEYFHAENDKYWLFALINDWIVPCSVGTEYAFENHCCGEVAEKKLYGDFDGRQKFFDNLRAGCTSAAEVEEAIKKQIKIENELTDSLRNDDSIKAEYLRKQFDKSIDNYIKAREGVGNFPDFIGAVFVGEVENCLVLANKRREQLDKENKERSRLAAEKKRAEEEAEAREAEEEIKNAENVFMNGGKLTGGRMVCNLADKYGVSIPIKTRGWILDRFAQCIFDGDEMRVSFYKRKNNSGSTKIYDVLSEIKAAIKKGTEAM